MMDIDPLIFDVNIAKNKPNSYRKVKNNSGCPFCEVDSLENIYQKNGDMIWLRNKYPTLRDTVQTVLIESSDHHGDIATYSKAFNRQLIRFSLNCFNKMRAQKQFKSVLWYKNFGPNSGGSLVHPHMQIVGLEKQDGYRYINEANFKGITLLDEAGVEVNVSTAPIHGYVELNLNLCDLSSADLWADWIQAGTKYMLNVVSKGRCDSYNLFFYPREGGKICAKLIARFAASPYFVGYKLPQVDNREKLLQEAEQFRAFFEEEQD